MKSKNKIMPYQFGNQDVEILKKEKLFSRFFNVSLVTFKHKLFAGVVSACPKRNI